MTEQIDASHPTITRDSVVLLRKITLETVRAMTCDGNDSSPSLIVRHSQKCQFDTMPAFEYYPSSLN